MTCGAIDTEPTVDADNGLRMAPMAALSSSVVVVRDISRIKGVARAKDELALIRRQPSFK